MKETVQRILQEEQSSRARVEVAQNQAQDIVRRANEETISLIQNAVDKAKDLSRQRIEEAEVNSLEQKEKILKDARSSIALARDKREKDIPKIAREIFRNIITIRG